MSRYNSLGNRLLTALCGRILSPATPTVTQQSSGLNGAQTSIGFGTSRASFHGCRCSVHDLWKEDRFVYFRFFPGLVKFIRCKNAGTGAARSKPKMRRRSRYWFEVESFPSILLFHWPLQSLAGMQGALYQWSCAVHALRVATDCDASCLYLNVLQA